ncbi:DNA-3-methyladenine glycosylase I [Amnibacterium endophyticum]|uniref:DNA-3-methyladenine glycosylase I n=1 Tax=Amnibacterium endophyticum TaxID=2109337 RepID=A0ABW4LEI2_9MICO
MTTVSATTGDDGRPRCPWAVGDLYRAYHDDEWGVPLHGDCALFEKLTLEGFQSGLSWIVVLRKRETFRTAFAGFDPAAVAAFGDEDVERLLADAGIIRNRQKIEAAIGNARALVALQERDGDDALDRLVWSFADAARAEHVAPDDLADVPAQTPASKALAKALHAEGLRFVGPVTVYSLMQSAGLVDDHVAGCWRAAAR